MKRDRLGTLLAALAVPFVLAALFHLAALVAPALAPDDPPWRHALFVVVNLACAVGFWRRPRAFVPLFALLVLQQTWSHGRDLVATWSAQGRLEWRAALVLPFLPLAWGLLWIDARRRRDRARRADQPGPST